MTKFLYFQVLFALMPLLLLFAHRSNMKGKRKKMGNELELISNMF